MALSEIGSRIGGVGDPGFAQRPFGTDGAAVAFDSTKVSGS